MSNRYEFTDKDGYVVVRLEAPTALEAAEHAASLTRVRPLHCTHLSDGPGLGASVDPAFFYGPGDEGYRV